MAGVGKTSALLISEALPELLLKEGSDEPIPISCISMAEGKEQGSAYLSEPEEPPNLLDAAASVMRLVEAS